MNNLAIVIFSCDKNDEIWHITKSCFDKYWKNHPTIYLLTETKKCAYMNTINYDYDIDHWTTRIRKSLKDIKEEKIIFICDDCFLDKEVNVEKLKRSIELLDKGYSAVHFELSWDQNDADTIYEGFKEKTKKSIYKISLLCGLWKKEKLIEILQKDTDPWTIESEQNYGDNKFLQVTGEKVISWFNDQYGGNGAIRFGKWQHCTEEFLKKENLYVDYSKKGFNE